MTAEQRNGAQRPPAPFNGGLEELPEHHPLFIEGRPHVSWFPRTGKVITHHPLERCESPCPIHRPGEHHMVTWQLHWRDDRRIFERICEHGVGHPDPDSTPEGHGVHGCDGCCDPSKAAKPNIEG